MPNIIYRNIEERDFDDLFALVCDWEVVRQLGSWPWPPDKDITSVRCGPYEGDGFVWAICDNDRFVGSIGVTEGSVGYMLSPAYAGMGVMTAAVEVAIDESFQSQTLVEISACTWFDNPASAKVLTKTGFVETGACEIHALARNEKTLSINFKLSRDRWRTLRSHKQ